MTTNLQVTLWPTFPHFERFATDHRLSGIRMNSAMIHAPELDAEIDRARSISGTIPLYFDVKGRQLRIKEAITDLDHLELRLHRPISVKTPTPVLFKAGEDASLLVDVQDDGKHLIFRGGPEYMVHAGESIHIREPSLQVGGDTFSDYEVEKIDKVVRAGFDRYYLSYCEGQRDIDAFREFIGDAELFVKVENKVGLDFVANEWKPQPNTHLCAARGDLYVELDMPHQILEAVRLIVDKDPGAIVGSRMLLSMVDSSVPRCADFSDLAWLHQIGYRNMLLCDELCLKEELLGRAINAFAAFRSTL